MLVGEFEQILDVLAPFSLAESWDNVGLQVGDRSASVRRVLLALEVTEPVIEEAVAGRFDTVLTHHPLLFEPVRTLVESRPRERLLRRLVAEDINVISCHTNLDSAPGGIGDMAAAMLGLTDLEPVQHAAAGWYKLVGFIPPDHVEQVASAVFAAGAGTIGDYQGCAFSASGHGWFTPGLGASPAIGQVGSAERTPEIRWETVVPRSRLQHVVRAYVEVHPYEEPAFDVYPVEDTLPRVGLGRIGTPAMVETVEGLALRLGGELGLGRLPWTGDGSRTVSRVAVVPGSGRSLLGDVIGRAEVLVTGDVGHHDAERAEETGVALIAAPHGELEWHALKRWVPAITERVAGEEVEVITSEKWRSPWNGLGSPTTVSSGERLAQVTDGATSGTARLFVDGGSRGNPGPSAIGVVLQNEDGETVAELAQIIDDTTNNVAEYRALLAGFQLARGRGFADVEVLSDSELLVRQVNGLYKVKSDALRPLFDEAMVAMKGFRHVTVIHVEREKNADADMLVNQALDAFVEGQKRA